MRAEDAALTDDLTERSKNVSGASKDERRSGAARSHAEEGSEIGWGLSAEDQEERFFIKRIAFSLVVAVVACAGAYMVLTTLSSRGVPNLALSAKVVAPAASPAYTVVLWQGAASGAGAVQQIIGRDEVKALAGRNEFHSLELQDGSKAMCVGRFDDPDSPQLKQLLAKFREVRISGARPFQAARIQGYRE